MSTDRSRDVKVERSAVLAVERSILTLTDLTTAVPVNDWGVDLIAFAPDPFCAVPIQVKGASRGLKVFRQYSLRRMIVAYVLRPEEVDAQVVIMTGEEAWKLPETYIAAGGRASDHRPSNEHYRWARVSGLLEELLASKVASRDRWQKLIEQASIS